MPLSDPRDFETYGLAPDSLNSYHIHKSRNAFHFSRRSRGGHLLAKLSLLSGPASIKRHAVFIHGVRFSKSPVWMSAGKNPEAWPTWLASDIEGLAVWSVEHDSAPTLWSGDAMHHVDRANNILPLLQSEARLGDGDISFVAHSFGGLIVQQLLRSANDRAEIDPKAADLIRRVRSVVFLGTPHRGADLATWADVCRVVLRPSFATKGLLRNDPPLRDLNYFFRSFAAAKAIETRTLTESRKTFGFWIVPPDTADPGLPSTPIPIDANHFEIASPVSKDAEVYGFVRDFLSSTTRTQRGQVIPDEDVLKEIATHAVETLERIERSLTANRINAKVVPAALVDAETERRLLEVRRSRFFLGSSFQEDALRIATELLSGELFSASIPTKARALAWCARLLFSAEDKKQAYEFLAIARGLERPDEVVIAEAFGRSHADDHESALALLSKLQSPASRSASFIIVKNKLGALKALDWLVQAGYRIDDLDADGKLFVISAQLEVHNFHEALASVDKVKLEDFADTPALYWSSATANLAAALPAELAIATLSEPAFALLSFPFADDRRALDHRRKAADLYKEAASSAALFGCTDASNGASDRALLLNLLDGDRHLEAIRELEESMRSQDRSLRRLPLALQTDLKLDLVKVESEIDREEVRSAGGSITTAIARLAIARSKLPKDAPYLYRNASRSVLKTP